MQIIKKLENVVSDVYNQLQRVKSFDACSEVKVLESCNLYFESMDRLKENEDMRAKFQVFNGRQTRLGKLVYDLKLDVPDLTCHFSEKQYCGL